MILGVLAWFGVEGGGKQWILFLLTISCKKLSLFHGFFDFETWKCFYSDKTCTYRRTITFNPVEVLNTEKKPTVAKTRGLKSRTVEYHWISTKRKIGTNGLSLENHINHSSLWTFLFGQLLTLHSSVFFRWTIV